MQTYRIIFAMMLSAVLLQQTAGAAESDMNKLAWLGGCWQGDPAEPGTIEQWLPLNGGTLLGVGRTVKKGKTVDFEFMKISEDADGVVAFHAQPSGKPAATFRALKLTENEVVFENLQHDFPQRVIYARDGDAKLNARIEGLRNGVLRAIPFPMVKVSCDALLKRDR